MISMYVGCIAVCTVTYSFSDSLNCISIDKSMDNVIEVISDNKLSKIRIKSHYESFELNGYISQKYKIDIAYKCIKHNKYISSTSRYTLLLRFDSNKR